ncbi:MAG: hypothetical protein RLZZ616_2785 [Pseudomonadota bacterium]
MLAVQVISDAYSNRIRLAHQTCGRSPSGANGSNKKSDPKGRSFS